MHVIFNTQRIIQCIVLLLCGIMMHLHGYSYEGNMLYANISLVTCMFLIWWNASFISIKFFLSFILYSVVLVPGIAYYLFGLKFYSYVNFDHQLIDECTAYTLLLYFLSFNVYTFILIAKDKIEYKPAVLKNNTRLPFYFLGFGVLLFTYLAESGGTLITASYDQLMDERSSLMTLAGVALSAFWADFYAKYREYLVVGYKKRMWIFWIITALSVLWLVLHARRTELIGFLSLILIHRKMIVGKNPIVFMGMGAVFLFILYVIGYTRVGAMTEINVMDQVNKSLATTFESSSSQTEFANLPSGLGNIAETMQTSVYHFYYMGNDFLNGLTMYTYPLKMIPSNLIQLANLPSTEEYFYNNLVLENYYYNGGTYVLAPSYGNFGMFGFIIAAIFFACLIRWTHTAFHSNDYLKIVVATTVIFLFIKVVWYSFLPLTKSLFYNFIMLGGIALFFGAQRMARTTSFGTRKLEPTG